MTSIPKTAFHAALFLVAALMLWFAGSVVLGAVWLSVGSPGHGVARAADLLLVPPALLGAWLLLRVVRRG